MIFLIEYDRKRGRLVSFDRFDDAQKQQAEDSRLALDLKLNRTGVEREVVILEASDELALHRTHRRYFADLEDLARLPDETEVRTIP